MHHRLSTRRLGRALAVSTVLAASLALAACGGSDTSDGSSAGASASSDLSGVTIKVGGQGSDNQAGFVASGLFKDAPYTIEYPTFPSPANTLTALASGKIDIANNVSQWTATQASAGEATPWTSTTAPYKNILVSAPGNPQDFSRFVIAASKQSGITDIAKAKGKKWGIIPGSSLNLFSEVVLKKLGWTRDDVKVVNLDATNQVLALQSGQVDVLFNVTDNLAPALSTGAKIIGTANDYGLTLYTGYLASTQSLADPKKDAAIKDFTKRLVEYQDWYITHPDEAQKALVDFNHVTPEQATQIWEYSRILPKAPSAEVATYSQSLADLAQQVGLINKKVDASTLLDDRYASTIEDALKSTDLVADLKASYTK